MSSSAQSITDVLPVEVMCKIVAAVGRGSICHLFNLISSNKVLRGLGKEQHVLKDVNLECDI